MAYDVAVLIPAWRADLFIARAVASVLRQEGVRPQIVIAADDGRDYLGLLAAQGIDCETITLCRTAREGSGPGPARSLAAGHADAPLLALLDADDEYCDGHLARLVEAARRRGAAAGPTLETRAGAVERIGRPRNGRGVFTPGDICGLRMPLFPVFDRSLLADGWPDLPFAEDMVFNFGLALRAGGMGFVAEAGYRYHLRADSLTENAASLARALRGYGVILTYLESVDWPAEWAELLRGVIGEDIAAAQAALARGDGRSWRQAVSRPRADPAPSPHAPSPHAAGVLAGAPHDE